MRQDTKNGYLKEAARHVAKVREQILFSIAKIKERIETKISIVKIEDGWTNAQLKIMDMERLKQMHLLHESPYFTKCEIIFDDSNERKIFYFGKFSFTEEKIYSWIAPVASVRFEKPGVCTYTLPNGKTRKGVLISKEQYSIINGKIVLYTTETLDNPTELIYQENFSNTKPSFALPEIVSQIEKAQDKVIRAHYKGPFVISGPAGSGKTTLALHRIAYLVQSPNTSALYEPHSMMVLVQDEKTKTYFSELLPSLGINSVTITTFSEWATNIIDLQEIYCVSQYVEDDFYEYEKIKALRASSIPNYNKNIFNLLKKVYEPFLSKENLAIFNQQKKDKKLDRIDATILLQSFRKTHKKLSIKRFYNSIDADGNFVEKYRIIPMEYSLIVVDEFQNYLPEQLKLFKTCVDKDKDSLIYTGDMSQQIRCGTIKNWEQMQQTISADRYVILDKVYRNTWYILNHIKNLGYNIEIPKDVKQGVPVVEIEIDKISNGIKYIEELIFKLKQGETLAVLTKYEKDLHILQDQVSHTSNVHILSMRQSQGLEFDKVCIFQFYEKSTIDNTNTSFLQEKKQIDKDLLYVALTRAISELHIIRNSKPVN